MGKTGKKSPTGKGWALHKWWTTQDGNYRAGKLLDKTSVYQILNNRTYLGELRHKEQWFKAEHPPLIERSVFDAVQAILDVNPRVRANNTRAKIPFLLKGVVEGHDGRALTPAWTRKGNGRLYRYYMHTRENKEFAGASGLPRLPATELEATVVEQMRRVWRNPEMIARVSEHAMRLDPDTNEAHVWIAMNQIDKIWEQLFPAEQHRIVRLLVEKVIVTPHNIEVRFRSNGIEMLAKEVKTQTTQEVSA